MPIYEYECAACGHEFEREQRITEPPLKTCPRCRARRARRLISRTSFVLKGGGWYSDLYSSAQPDKGQGETAAESPAASEEAGASEAKSEPKKKKKTKKKGPKAAA